MGRYDITGLFRLCLKGEKKTDQNLEGYSRYREWIARQDFELDMDWRIPGSNESVVAAAHPERGSHQK